ncbi:MAG: DUF2490 domain-containing protein [Halieaceae bacterium]|jgi:hypothetical protein|nr:DUF2490 domain-containing protein [Halieaceae bacterium]
MVHPQSRRRSVTIASSNPSKGRQFIRIAKQVSRLSPRTTPVWALGLLALLGSGGAAPGWSFEQETQTWTTAQLVTPITGDTALGLRYRTRFSGFFEGRSLYQYQVAAGKALGDDLRVDLGYELFRSRRGTVEHRYFPQLQLRSSWAQLPFRQRLRLELRDLVIRDELAYRLRYLVGHRRPLGDGGAYLELRNEVFFSLSEGDGLERGFVQNRVGATVGQRIGHHLRAEVRYQYGYVDNAVLTRGDHLIQFYVLWDRR